jgi:hypothetical protein
MTHSTLDGRIGWLSILLAPLFFLLFFLTSEISIEGKLATTTAHGQNLSLFSLLLLVSRGLDANLRLQEALRSVGLFLSRRESTLLISKLFAEKDAFLLDGGWFLFLLRREGRVSLLARDVLELDG